MKMKILSVLLLILLFSVSCEKEPDIRFGFDTEFGKNSKGISIMNVSRSSLSIRLKGDVVLNEGEISIELVDPSGEVLFEKNIISIGSLCLEESFYSVPGNWTLRYKSKEGSGHLILHLNAVK